MPGASIDTTSCYHREKAFFSSEIRYTTVQARCYCLASMRSTPSIGSTMKTHLSLAGDAQSLKALAIFRDLRDGEPGACLCAESHPR